MRCYTLKTTNYVQEANKFRYNLRTAEKNIERTQNKYYKMCKKRDKCEQEIEKAIQEHEKGNLTFAQVQKKSNQAFDIKKQTEMNYHEYLSELECYNKLIEDSHVLYKDYLNKLQDQDEQRIDSVKQTLNGFFKTFSEVGEILKDKIEESITSIELINTQTDMKIFIDENRSRGEFYKKKDFVSFDYSKLIMKNRKERLNSKESMEDFIEFGKKKPVEYSNIRASVEGFDENLEESKINAEYDLLGLSEFESSKEDKKETEGFNNKKEFVQDALEGLFKGKELSQDDQLKVLELIHENYIS